jgi:hypothetical protein
VQAVIVIALSAIALGAAADPLRPDPAEDIPSQGFVARGPARPPAPPPTPAPEMANLGKPIAGTWKCTGAVAKLEIKVALDNAWIEWRVTGGAGTTLQFRTFDKVAKQWTMLELTSATQHHEATSLGPEGETMSRWTWQVGDDHREHEDISKDQIALWGERRSGTAWHKNYDATCRRSK